MKTMLLLLIMNLPTGESVEIVWKRDLAPAQCAALVHEIADAPHEIAYYDDQGPVPDLDARCVWPAQLSAPE